MITECFPKDHYFFAVGSSLDAADHTKISMRSGPVFHLVELYWGHFLTAVHVSYLGATLSKARVQDRAGLCVRKTVL